MINFPLSKKLKTLSLFSGAGGLDLGFHSAGFDIKYCIEIDKIITQVTKSKLNSKQLYKILKKTHFSPKMIIDLHKFILNLSREHHLGSLELYGSKINHKFFIDCCKNVFSLDNPDNWK